MSKLIWQPAKMPSLKGKVAVVTGAKCAPLRPPFPFGSL